MNADVGVLNGNSTLNFSGSTQAITFKIRTVTGGGNVIKGSATIGSSFHIGTGSTSGNTNYYGGSGNDTFKIKGDWGSGTLYPNGGSDVIYTNTAGNVDASGNNAASPIQVYFNSMTNSTTLTGGAGSDKFVCSTTFPTTSCAGLGTATIQGNGGSNQIYVKGETGSTISTTGSGSSLIIIDGNLSGGTINCTTGDILMIPATATNTAAVNSCKVLYY